MDEFGTRFPDMTNLYDRELSARIRDLANDLKMNVNEGVYAYLQGPSFETPAEIKALRVLGADAVGMSTVPETIVARHMGVPVFGMSVITNCGLSDQKGDHEDVQLQGRLAGERMSKLFVELIKQL
jgi:purine-nucleoside phosphorylase